MYTLTLQLVTRLLLAVLTLCLIITSPMALAQNPCNGAASLINPALATPGIGGTGAPSGLATPGIGGTGAPELQPQVPGRDGPALARTPGIGGTGLALDGAGDIGVMGVITGFASICVNGIEVHYDSSTPVAADGQLIHARALAVGQVVSVHAVGKGDQLSARSIAVTHAAVGPVGKVDHAQHRQQTLAVPLPSRFGLQTQPQCQRQHDKAGLDEPNESAIEAPITAITLPTNAKGKLKAKSAVSFQDLKSP